MPGWPLLPAQGTNSCRTANTRPPPSRNRSAALRRCTPPPFLGNLCKGDREGERTSFHTHSFRWEMSKLSTFLVKEVIVKSRDYRDKLACQLRFQFHQIDRTTSYRIRIYVYIFRFWWKFKTVYNLNINFNCSRLSLLNRSFEKWMILVGKINRKVRQVFKNINRE